MEDDEQSNQEGKMQLKRGSRATKTDSLICKRA